MSTSNNKRVNHLVVDSSAFIRQAPLHVCSIVLIRQSLKIVKESEKRILGCSVDKLKRIFMIKTGFRFREFY